MNVFICVCASNRPSLLNKALYSLSKINKPNEIFLKIFVIDNDIYRSNKQIVDRYKNNKSFRINYVYEPKKGIVFARNKFLSCIRKINKRIDLIGFVDDDCVVHKDWLINHIQSLKNKFFKISTGPQVIKNLTIKEKIFYDLTNKQEKEIITKTKWAATNNVIFDYSILRNQKIKFDKNLNDSGGSDQLFFLKLNKIGHKIVWNKNALVYENKKNKKFDDEWFAKRNLRYGYSGAYMFIELYGKIVGTIFNIFKLFYFFYKLNISIIEQNKIKRKYKFKSYIYKINGLFKFYFGKKITKYY